MEIYSKCQPSLPALKLSATQKPSLMEIQPPQVLNNYENTPLNPNSDHKKPHHRQHHSDGEFWVAGDDELGFSGDMEDDFVSAYLNLENDEGGSSSCLVGPAGVEEEKGVRKFNRYGELLEGLVDGAGAGAGAGAGEVVSYEAKKAIPAEKLAEMWTVDPKRVKRILANRQSAARSKERKARYISELERKLYALQSEATNLSAQLTIYQRDTTALISENAELKIRLQNLEHQAHFRDVVNEALKQEVERMKSTTGEMRTPGSDPLSLRIAYSPAPSPYSPGISPSPHNTANYFPLPKKQVPLLAQLPPFPSPSSRRRQTNKIAPHEQNEYRGGSSSNLVNMDLGPNIVSPRNDHSSSTRQLMSP